MCYWMDKHNWFRREVPVNLVLKAYPTKEAPSQCRQFATLLIRRIKTRCLWFADLTTRQSPRRKMVNCTLLSLQVVYFLTLREVDKTEPTTISTHYYVPVFVHQSNTMNNFLPPRIASDSDRCVNQGHKHARALDSAIMRTPDSIVDMMRSSCGQG